jgi:hypothetical protein
MSAFGKGKIMCLGLMIDKGCSVTCVGWQCGSEGTGELLVTHDKLLLMSQYMVLVTV